MFSGLFKALGLNSQQSNVQEERPVIELLHLNIKLAKLDDVVRIVEAHPELVNAEFSTKKYSALITACSNIRPNENSGNDHETEMLKIVEFLLNSGANINQCDAYLRTPVHHAIRFGRNLDLITFLVNNRAKLDMRDDEGDNVLHMAASGQFMCLEIMQFLTSNCDKELLFPQTNKYGKTAYDVVNEKLESRNRPSILPLLVIVPPN